jgi:signal transduction histidine kinase
VDLGEVVAVVVSDLGDLIRRRDATVRIHGPLPVIWGDRDRIGQLLANLIANGLRYNQSQEPRVEIGVADSTKGRHEADLESSRFNGTTIYVKDNGIGVEPQFHETIFQLFRRLHTQEEYEGTGAGLAISSKIVEAHGGRIWLESTPGRGSTFFIRLPCPPEASPSVNPSETPSFSSIVLRSTVSQVAPDEHNEC